MREQYTTDNEANASWKAEESESSKGFDAHSGAQREKTLLDKFRGRAGDVAKVLTVVTALTVFGELPKAQALNMPKPQNYEQPTKETGGWRRATPQEQAEAAARSEQPTPEEGEKQSEEDKGEKQDKKQGRVKKETSKVKERVKQGVKRQIDIEIWRQQGRIERKIGEILRFPR